MSFNECLFGKYPNDWNLINLGDLISVITDYHANGSYKKLKENVELKDDEDYAVMIRTTNFEQGAFNNSDFKYISKDAYEFLSKTKVYENDLLMNKIANAGSVYRMPRINKPVSLAMNLFLIRANEEKLNNVYMYYFLKNYEAYVKMYAEGSVTKTITKDNVRKLKIAYPEIDEQNAICNVLEKIEKKVDTNNKINQRLEEMAQSIFKHWFVDFEFPNGEGKPYKSSGGEMVESELGMIPKGWKVVELDEIVKTYNGYSYKGKELLESNDAMVTIKNFDRNGGYKIDGLKEIVISEKVKEHHYVDIGDIVVAHTDLTQGAEIIGNPIIITSKSKYNKLIMSMDTVKVESKKEYISNNIIYMILKDRRFKVYALGHMNGTTVLHLSKKCIPSYKIAISDDKKLFERLEKVIASLIYKQINLIKQNERMSNLRDILLPKLMSGEIRVQLKK